MLVEIVKKTIQEMEKRCPRKNFLIKLIYQLKPDHEIFEVDYEPPTEESITQKYEQKTIEVPANLIEISVGSKRKAGGRKMRMPIPEEDKEKMAREKLEAKIKALLAKKKDLLEKQQEKHKKALARRTTTFNFFNQPKPVKSSSLITNFTPPPTMQAAESSQNPF